MRWLALFSQTGSEIYEVAKQLDILPDLIIYNTNFGKIPINPNLIKVAGDRMIISEPKPKSIFYHSLLRPDDIVTLNGWLRIVPPDVCDAYEIYNGHPGLVDVYLELRGKDPQRKAYELELDKSGCVIHRCTSIVDAGEIVERVEVGIANLELEDIIEKLHDESIKLWVKFLKKKLK